MATRETAIQCSRCGSEYILTMTRLSYRDHDVLNCVICGTELKRWNESKSWDAVLTKRANGLGLDNDKN